MFSKLTRCVVFFKCITSILIKYYEISNMSIEITITTCVCVCNTRRKTNINIVVKWTYRSGEIEVSFPLKLKVFCKGSKMVKDFFSTGRVLVNGIPGSPEDGLIGVITSFIEEINKTLAVMWFLPSSGEKIGKFWNIYLYNGNRTPNNAMLLRLLISKPIAAGEELEYKNLNDSNLKFDGFMSNSDKATLMIKVYK